MGEPIVELYLPNMDYAPIARLFPHAVKGLAKPCITHSGVHSSFNFALIDDTLAAEDTLFGQAALFLLADDRQSIDTTVAKINGALRYIFNTDPSFNCGVAGDKKPLGDCDGYERPIFIPASQKPLEGIYAEPIFTDENNKMIQFLKTLGTALKEPKQRFELAKAVEEEYFSRRTLRMIS